jgi:predicted nuclease of predicted toxin-antitoxin system
MRVLIDSCLSYTVGDVIAAAADDVETVHSWPSDPGDAEILAIAYQQGRVLITMDKGFGMLVMRERMPHVGIIRLTNTPAEQHAELCLLVLERNVHELEAGAMIIADPERVRIRSPHPDA